MAHRRVHTQRVVSQDAGRVWRIIAGFDLSWHPAVSKCQVFRAPTGALLREFLTGDGGCYTEQRTYLSHSDRILGYTALTGIEGAFAYHAQVHVADADDGALITWEAEIFATEVRIEDIAVGTEQIFEAALEALAGAKGRGRGRRLRVAPGPAQIALTGLPGSPDLKYLSCLDRTEVTTRPLVIFLHGIGGQASNWAPQLSALGADFDVAALNLRGYGGSDLGQSQSRVEDYSADILRLADSAGAKQVVLVGLSYGAWIATSFAMRYPDRLVGLVLAGGCTGMSEASVQEREAFRAAREGPLEAGQSPADFAPSVVEIIAGPEASEATRGILHRSMSDISVETYRDALGCFCNPMERFDFSSIGCPVLLLTGAHDRLAPPDEMRAVSQRMKAQAQMSDIQFEVIAQAGHVCNLEQPEAFNTHLSVFLERLPGVARDDQPNARERQQAKRTRILNAAHAVFCEAGFDGASMDVLARRADVSKPTLYQYFGDKEGLFAAVLDAGRAQIVMPLVGQDGDLVERLWQFSWTYAAFVLRPDMLSLARLILGEATRRPDSAVAYHQAGPGMAFAGLVEFIKSAEAAGDLATRSAEYAAQDLWSLILSGPRDYYLHHAQERPKAHDVLGSIAHGLRMFLRLYACEPDPALRALDQKVACYKATLVEGAVLGNAGWR